jgi:hypothetical protein
MVEEAGQERAPGVVHGAQRYSVVGSGSAQWELANRVRSGRKQR